MKNILIKTRTFLFFILGLFLGISSVAKAEVINDFQSIITVSPDSSITVQEKIIYDFEGAIKHGIYRDISLLNSQNEPMKINVISVKDQNGSSHPFTTTVSGENINIKIGDPNRTLSGMKEYDITYRVFGAIGYYDNYDEIYWNVTGNNWQIPIKNTSASVFLPNNIIPKQESCYFGRKGNTTKCNMVSSGSFSSPGVLNNGEGLTIAVGFEKGIVAVYEIPTSTRISRIVRMIWPIIFPILAFIFLIVYRKKRGKIPKGTGIIIPQYDVPDNLTPIEVKSITKGKIESKDIPAEIIYLATQGYLKIKRIEGKKLKIFSKKDYTLILLKESKELSNEFDRDFLDILFGVNAVSGGTVNLSTLKDQFLDLIFSIKTKLFEGLINKGYYIKSPSPLFSFFNRGNPTKRITSVFITITIIVIFFGEMILNFLGSVLYLNPIILLISAIATIIILFILSKNMSNMSVKGVEMKEYLLGFKKYLQIAEKDRINFHNAPEKRPEIFEKLLPYAMVFGVEKLWAKEFKDIYVNPPNWYEGSSGNFSTINFSHNMTMFSNFTTGILSSTPGGGGGGSGGGGSSGGGGGGGGGGSW